MRFIESPKLLGIVTDAAEYALIDVRERGRFACAHLLLAINLPCSRLELSIRQYVPRLGCPVVLCDAGEGLAERAAVVLEACGYTRVSVCVERVGDWRDAGFEVFRGHYAMTYAFGLYVAKCYATPAVSAAHFETRRAAGEPLVLLDGRPAGEVSYATIPGSVGVPFTEMVYRLGELLPDADTPVVVNCGAVTRGMLGAQTLIEAGIGNSVAALTNGVRGWDFAGFEVERGSDRFAGGASPTTALWSDRANMRLGAQVDVEYISFDELTRWRAEAEQRTLYIVDIRSRKEFLQGHLPGSVSIIGAELVGLYEDYIGTMNARVCLVDDNGIRATVTAGWLQRMGWPEVAVLDGGIAGHKLMSGPALVPEVRLDDIDVATISAGELAEQIASENIAVIDFALSDAYKMGHIPAAWWTTRAYLPDLACLLPAARTYVSTCADGRLARLAAKELQTHVATPVVALEDGTEGWVREGNELVSGATRILGPVDDVALEFLARVDDDWATRRAAHRRTAQWQHELLSKIERDASFSFPVLRWM